MNLTELPADGRDKSRRDDVVAEALMDWWEREMRGPVAPRDERWEDRARWAEERWLAWQEDARAWRRRAHAWQAAAILLALALVAVAAGRALAWIVG